MKSCSYCGELIEYKGTPVELKIFDYYTDGKNQRFINFCNDKCTMKFLDDHIQKNKGMGFLYQLIYYINPQICELCGNYTHPTEFCMSHGTQLCDVEEFRRNFVDGEFIGPGVNIDVEGSIVRILKPSCFEVDLDIAKYSSEMGLYESSIFENEDNFKQSRLPLACLQDQYDQVEYLFDKNKEELIEKSNEEIYFIRGWNIRRVEDTVIDETLHDLTFNYVRKIEREDKMFLPLNILQQRIKYPTQKFVKDEFSTTFTGKYLMCTIRGERNNSESSSGSWDIEDGTIRL